MGNAQDKFLNIVIIIIITVYYDYLFIYFFAAHACRYRL